MNSKLRTLIPAVVVIGLIAVLTTVPAVVAHATDKKNVVNPTLSVPTPSPIDPTTGLPVLPPAPWKDPNWKDPDKVLTDFSYDGVPLSEVADHLREQFKGAFDVLTPNERHDPNNPAVAFDPRGTPIKMQLKNVTASEVFNAMNLVFETDNTPLRWELKMNGNRPTAVLRVLGYAYAPPPDRKIYFVGDLIGDEKSGGMTMEQLVKTVSEVYEMSYGTSQDAISAHLQFHKQAQLLIVTSTVDQEGFVLQTIVALREKARLEHKPLPPKAAEAKVKTEAPKAP
jgi:hypothetical protein